MQHSLLLKSGIFVRLFLGLLLSFVCVALGTWLIGSTYQQIPQNYGAIDQGHFAIRAVSTAMSVSRWGGEVALKRWLLDKDSNYRPEVFVLNSKGEEITGRTIPEKAREQLKDPEFVASVPKGMHHRRMQMDDLRYFAVRTDRPPRSILAALWHTPWWVHVLLALGAAAGIAALLAWSFSHPIHKLNWAMKRASEGDLNVRIAHEVGRSYDEIGALARRYDTMAEKIQTLLSRQKRLFHDVSHELRSPLARIEVAIAVAQRNSERTDEMLQRIEREVTVLDTLVDELLTYARLDDSSSMTFEAVDLVTILEDIIDNANFEGDSRQISVTLSSPESLEIEAHIESLNRAFENIIRNALRFSPNQGAIRVALSQRNQEALIEITDCGPGMSPSDLEKLFLPFVRGSDSATGNGFGLGLAIAKRAIERHGGRIEAQNVEPHGLAMHIAIPIKHPKSV